MSTLNVMYVRKKTKVRYTAFGVPECEDKNVYEENAYLLEDKVIVKIDALQCLENMFDKGMFIDRGLLYQLFSGSVEQGIHYGELLATYYKKFPSFANYIDGATMFEDEDRNLLQNIMIPIRNKINNFKVEVKAKAGAEKGRLVLDTHDYIYIAYKLNDYKEIPNIRIEQLIKSEY